MGSYASINYRNKNGEWKIVTMFNHKFLGYIEDEEAAQLLSVKYLISRDPRLTVELLNSSYIHTVAWMTEWEARIFMVLYAYDFENMFPDIPDPLLWDDWLPEWSNIKTDDFELSFD